MARKKQEEEMVSPADMANHIIAQYEKEYGAGVLISGLDYADLPHVHVSWSPVFDVILSGPIEDGSWIGITGPEKVGKTTSALTLAASAQKAGMRVFYDKVEGRMSSTHLRGIAGLDLSGDAFRLIQSTPERILSAEDHLQILRGLMTNTDRSFFIIDSISAYVDEKELTDGIGSENRGRGAKLFSQFVRLMNQVVPTKRHIVVGITHLISNTSGQGPKYHERAARMWGYQCDYKLRANYRQAWMARGRQVGLEVNWTCYTSKNGPPGMKMNGLLRFGVGIDRIAEAMRLGASLGLIRRSGAWYYLDFLGQQEAPKYQGEEAVYQALRDSPAMAESLVAQVMDMAGSIVVGCEGGEE